MMPRVLERWPHAKLLLVGEGLARPGLEREARQAGVAHRVSFLGHRSDVRDVLAISDLFLFPSLSEGLGLALLEAAAAGKAVVASNCGPMPEVVEDGESGYLVEPGDAGALAEAVLRMLDSPDRMRRMGQRGQQIVGEKFDIRVAVRRLEEIYLSILEGHPSAKPFQICLNTGRASTPR
jgi:glycosyltransferase involved in cell wall biosynthesis